MTKADLRNKIANYCGFEHKTDLPFTIEELQKIHTTLTSKSPAETESKYYFPIAVVSFVCMCWACIIFILSWAWKIIKQFL